MDLDKQISGHLAYELPQSPSDTNCETLLGPCVTASSLHEPQQFFGSPTEQQDTVKLEDIEQSQPWEAFSSVSIHTHIRYLNNQPPWLTCSSQTSQLLSSHILEPVVPTPTPKLTRQQSVEKPRRERARGGTSGCSANIKREKNRIAASKCRRKKKDQERIFEERRRMLQVQNRKLMILAASLRAEILSLKHEILRHGTCDFQPINTYIANAAARVG